jgi:hypothetical protein
MRELEKRIGDLEQKIGLVLPLFVIHYCVNDTFSLKGKTMSNNEFEKWKSVQPEDAEIHIIELSVNEPTSNES